MKILVLGAGAREHALVHSFASERSQDGGAAHELHAAPGNPGIAGSATLHAVDANDPAAVTELAQQLVVDLVVIGPEAPLVAGVADATRAAGFATFGPSAKAAQLEGSKAFAKEIMAAAGVPTAKPFVCTTLDEVEAAFDDLGAPHVVKDDGLAAGKGVVVTSDRAEALAHAAECFANRGDGGRVVIEDFLDGPEVSLFVVSDGKNVVPLAPAQDFKRALNADAGPNTGGMGAYSPLDWAPELLTQEVIETVAQPTIDEMAKRGMPFAGILYVGLALTSKGTRVVEFNARFGDPETQVVLPRLKTPLSALLYAAATETLDQLPPLEWHEQAAVTVVVAAHNYPETPRAGDVITGIEQAEALANVHVLQAGTKLTESGDLVSAGGRVLSVVGVGADLVQAQAAVYQGVDQINLAGSHHRTDIAAKAIAGEIKPANAGGKHRA
ncbi:phosphoribosylamine--glycine ligase [Jonesiaceae bacterium BS-20]|uniref:Phosphoribosylamine--glycine ligase n=1 Tax=Jonesiaceae bacterium BS-20 TaxID=3120821 RepID=A0AAU7DWT5_9MICO